MYVCPLLCLNVFSKTPVLPLQIHMYNVQYLLTHFLDIGLSSSYNSGALVVGGWVCMTQKCP